MKSTENIPPLEKAGTWLDQLREWLGKSFRLSILLSKGAYIVGERRRLFTKLGEEVYFKISKGELSDEDLESTVTQLDRLSKKIEVQEIWIRSLRFGKRPRRSRKKSPPPKEGTAS